MKTVLAEVVYTCGKRTCYKSFIVKDCETLQALISFVTDSRFLVLSVRYYANALKV